MTQEQIALAALERVVDAIRGGQLRVVGVHLHDPPGLGALVVRWERVAPDAPCPYGHTGPVVDITDTDDPPNVRRYMCAECGTTWARTVRDSPASPGEADG